MSDCRVVIELTHEFAKMPHKAFPTDACFDLYIPESHDIGPGKTAVWDLGFRMELPEGWEAQIRGRSGWAKRGLIVHFGTIDHLYRHNVGVIVYNFSDSVIHVERGDRAAQMKLSRVFDAELVRGEVVEADRGGFGSTGS